MPADENNGNNQGQQGNTGGQPQGNGQGGTGGQTNGTFDLSKLPPEAQSEFTRIQEALKQANEESAGRRHELKALQKQIDEIKAGRTKELEEQGNFKTLAEQRASEIATLKAHQERADALEKMIRESNERRVKALPEDARGLVPVEYPPEKLATWLDTNFERLTKKPAPSTDAGAGGSGSGQSPIQLTNEQKQMAARFHMSDADYAKMIGLVNSREAEQK